MTDERKVPQAAWDAVFEVIRAEPRDAWENARTWRAVYAALRAVGFQVDDGTGES